MNEAFRTDRGRNCAAIEAVTTTGTEWKKTLALGLVGTTFVGTIFLTVPFVAMQLRSPLPYMATPKKKVMDALDFVSARRLGQNGRQSATPARKIRAAAANHSDKAEHMEVRLHFHDLGSGDGTSVLTAASKNVWLATGIELNPTLYFLSQIRRFFSPTPIKSKCKFKLGDMWSHDLRDSDAVMIFGVKPLMPIVARKIQQECKVGTCVLSYRFHVPLMSDFHQIGESAENNNLSNEKEEKGGAINATLVYEKEEMRVYELIDVKRSKP